MMRLLALCVFLSPFLALGQVGPLSFTNANRLYVDVGSAASLPPLKNRRDRPYSNITNALAVATPGDTIEMGSGTFTISTGSLFITNGITVIGRGPLTIISNTASGYTFQFWGDNIALRNLSIVGNRGIFLLSSSATNILLDGLDARHTLHALNIGGSSNNLLVTNSRLFGNPAFQVTTSGHEALLWASTFSGAVGLISAADVTNTIRFLACRIAATSTNIHALSGYLQLVGCLVGTNATVSLFENNLMDVTGYPWPITPGASILLSGPSANSVEFTVDVKTNSNVDPGVVPPAAGVTNRYYGTDGIGSLGFHPASGFPGGSDMQVQFNDSGGFGGDTGLTYDKTNKVLAVTNLIQASAIELLGDGAGMVLFADDDQSEVVTMRAHSNTVASYTIFLPTNAPGALPALSGAPVSGGAQLYWAAAGAGGGGFGSVSLQPQSMMPSTTTPAAIGANNTNYVRVTTWLTNQSGVWHVQVPTNYVSSPRLRLQVAAVNVAGTASWEARVWALKDAENVTFESYDTANTISGTVSASTLQPVWIESALSNFDSAAAGSTVYLWLRCTATNAVSTLSIMGGQFTYSQ